MPEKWSDWIGALGFALAVFSLCWQLYKGRVRLRVVPQTVLVQPHYVITRKDGPSFPSSVPPRLCVEVVNLSAFAVTVCEVGIKRKKRGTKRCLLKPVPPGDMLPKRLEPRQAMTVYAHEGIQADQSIATKAYAYARTECGYWKFGTSPAFRDYIRNA